MDIREAAPGTRSVLHMVTSAPHGRRVLLTTLLFRRFPLLGFLPCLSASQPYHLLFSSSPCCLKWLIMMPFGPLLFSCFVHLLHSPNHPKASLPPSGKWVPECHLPRNFSCFPRPWKCLLEPKRRSGVVTEFLKLDSPFLLLLEMAATMASTRSLCSHSVLLRKSHSTFLADSCVSGKGNMPFIFGTSGLFPYLWTLAAWRSCLFTVGVSSSGLHWKFPESSVGVRCVFILSAVTGAGLA